MQGLYKSTGYWQTQAAKADWNYLAKFAAENGLFVAAKELEPAPDAGWRAIDTRIQMLRGVLACHDIAAPPAPSNTIAFEKWIKDKEEKSELPPDQMMRLSGMPTLPGLEFTGGAE